MKKFLLLAIVICITACDNPTDTEVITSESKQNETIEPETPAENNAVEQKKKPATTTLSEFSDYKGICPEAWGIVEGAAQSHVESFVQNYIFVPENSGTMFSEINYTTLPDATIFLKAGTYNMVDTIVDQEMIATFAGNVMTQCGVRMRCDRNKNVWVSNCD